MLHPWLPPAAWWAQARLSNLRSVSPAPCVPAPTSAWRAPRRSPRAAGTEPQETSTPSRSAALTAPARHCERSGSSAHARTAAG